MDKHFFENIDKLMAMYSDGKLGGETMPEDSLIGCVPKNKMLDVLTLGMALNYQRSAYALWEAVANTYKDSELAWVFDPVAVSQSTNDDLQMALLQKKVALQPNRHPEIWQRVATGIVYSSSKKNVVGLLEAANYDVLELKHIMQETRKKEFPYLSGPKIFNYWLYVLESYSDIKWQSRDSITIAPDTHILKASVQLGLCDVSVLKGAAKDRERVAVAWREALKESTLCPIDIHTPLWLWSRLGFPELE